MSNKYWISSVNLSCSPGFRPGAFPPIKGLKEGLNVVWGANGIGKSSLARAIRNLLWKTGVASDVDADGIMETPSGSWALQLNRGELRQTDRSTNRVSSLPGRTDDLCQSYWFPLHELLQADENGALYLKRVRKEMQGGVDVKAARDNACAKSQFSSSKISEVSALKSGKEKIATIKRNQNENRNIYKEIADLEKQIAGISDLEKSARILESSHEIKRAFGELRGIEAKLAGYPAEIPYISEDDPGRLADLESLRTKRQEMLDTAKSELADLYNELEQCQIDKELLLDTALEDKQNALSTALDEAERSREQCRASHDRAKAASEEWERQHAWLFSSPPAIRNIETFVLALRKLASQCEPLRCALDSANRLKDILGQEQPIPEPIDSLRELSTWLKEWIKLSVDLAGKPRGIVVTSKFRLKVIAITIGLSLIIALATLLVHPLCLLGLIIIPIALWLIFPRFTKETEISTLESLARDARTKIEALIKTLKDMTLSEWTVSSCVELQGAAGKRTLEYEALAALNSERRNASEKAIAAAKALGDWRDSWESAADDLGLAINDPRLEGAQFYNFSQHLDAWLKAILEENRAAIALVAVDETHSAIRSDLQRQLHTAETSTVVLKGMAKDLIGRVTLARQLEHDSVKKTNSIAELSAGLAKSEGDIKEFWDKRRLQPGDAAKLADISSHVAEWKQHGLQRRNIEASLESLRALSAESTELAASTSIEELDLQITKTAGAISELNEKRLVLTRLQTKYQSLLDDDKLANALLDHKKATDALDAARRKDVVDRVVYELAERIAVESERELQPEVMRRANEWLGRITDSRYAISAHDEGFVANNLVEKTVQSLEQLSSGTRVQLLFALRMAFIETQEQSSNIKLPIFLDELLANSDDRRANAIASSICEIAKDRQVFYFTAQQDEVSKLKAICDEELNDVPLGVIADSYEAHKKPLKDIAIERTTIPQPVADYSEYAKLCKVPGIDLWNPVESAHTWHILNVSEELHACLERGMNRIGQVCNSTNGEVPYGKRLSMLQRLQALIRIGRSRPLSVSILEDHSLEINRSAGFWASTISYVTETNANGNQLIAALDNREIKGYRDDTKDTLKKWLTQYNYATEEVPLSKRDILGKLHEEFDFLKTSEDYVVLSRWCDQCVV